MQATRSGLRVRIGSSLTTYVEFDNFRFCDGSDDGAALTSLWSTSCGWFTSKLGAIISAAHKESDEESEIKCWDSVHESVWKYFIYWRDSIAGRFSGSRNMYLLKYSLKIESISLRISGLAKLTKPSGDTKKAYRFSMTGPGDVMRQPARKSMSATQ